MSGDNGGSFSVLTTVTFNANQLRAHLDPITDLDEVRDVTLVADVAAPPLNKIRTVVPPPVTTRFLGRAAGKLLVSLRVASRERPRWVLAYLLVPHGLNALIVGRLTRRRVLIHLIGGPREWVGGGWTTDNKVLGRLPRPVPALERLLLWAIRRADHLAVMGEEARQDLIARGVAADRVTVVPAGIDERLFELPRPAQPRYHIVTASQLIARKRLEDLLDAAAALKPRHPDLRVAIAGKGPLEAELRARAETLGIADAVDFLGFVDDMGSLYADSSVFALPSRSEGLSIAICEAMAVGLPVVSTDVGEVRDVIEPGVSGELFAVGDVDALTGALDRLLTDAGRRAEMGQSASRRVRKHCARSRIRDINRQILAQSP